MVFQFRNDMLHILSTPCIRFLLNFGESQFQFWSLAFSLLELLKVEAEKSLKLTFLRRNTPTLPSLLIE